MLWLFSVHLDMLMNAENKYAEAKWTGKKKRTPWTDYTVVWALKKWATNEETAKATTTAQSQTNKPLNKIGKIRHTAHSRKVLERENGGTGTKEKSFMKTITSLVLLFHHLFLPSYCFLLLHHASPRRSLSSFFVSPAPLSFLHVQNSNTYTRPTLINLGV